MRLIQTVLLGAALALCPALAAADPTIVASTQLISRHGHKTAFHVTPGNETTIVLDAGGGNHSTYWASLIPESSRRTGARIITYDRAGLGQSDVVEGPWSLDAATSDLEHGLRRLRATRNVILVSHSLAGEIATNLVRRHPRWFAGVVLVDANVPDVYTEDFIARAQAMYAPALAEIRAAPPTPQGRQLLALSESFVETSRAFHRMEWPSSVPATVIVAEHPPFETEADVQYWRDMHAQFAGRAPNRTLITAQGSSHDVAHDRPEIVLDAIAAYIQQAD